MQFNSVEYLLFLPVVFALYWLLARRPAWQNMLVVAASYVFYGWWDWHFLLLIAATSASSYACGLLAGLRPTRPRLAKGAVAVCVALNLGILCAYKYFDFFAASFCRLLAAFGLTADALTLNLVLPVGISFYTFQALSYCIDVYKGTIAAERDPVRFFAFISFFPQLVAGPIERAGNLLPQFAARRRFCADSAVSGLWLILWGLFKKMVIADNCALYVGQVFAGYSEVNATALWLAAALFSFQIYGDFSGYTDIARGSARLLGIELMENFRFPYFSASVGEFWRRWHISLTSWLRDYIYIPLGGSRSGRWRTYANTLAVFLVSGLWHGAAWTFVVWGGYHGLLLVLERVLHIGRRAKQSTAEQLTARRLWKSLPAVLATFLLAALGWVIFRSVSLGAAVCYLRRMLTFSGGLHCLPGRSLGLYILLLTGVELVLSGAVRLRWSVPRLVRVAVFVCFFLFVYLMGGDSEVFIYFQF